MAAGATIARDESIGSWALWFGVLAAPVAWGIQLYVNWALVEMIACAPGSRASGVVLGMSVTTWLLAIDAVLIAVATVGLVASLRCLRRIGDADQTPGGRAHWMARAGVFNSILFLLLLGLALAPPALVDLCEAGR